jgi:hypothetical protein
MIRLAEIRTFEGRPVRILAVLDLSGAEHDAALFGNDNGGGVVYCP